jgi:hypothetical protein
MLAGKARGQLDIAQASEDQNLQDDEEAAGKLPYTFLSAINLPANWV